MPDPEWACPRCHGYGITGYWQDGNHYTVTCPDCNGEGLRQEATR
jgi:DnaJ-class molecular chaperone